MKKLKQNRLASFAVIALIYLIATFIGITIYRMLDISWWLSLLISDAVATVIVFIFSVFFKNASVYDPYWSVQPPVILMAFAIGTKLTVLGILLIAVISLW